MHSERKGIDIKTIYPISLLEKKEHTLYTYSSNRHIHTVHLKCDEFKKLHLRMKANELSI